MNKDTIKSLESQIEYADFTNSEVVVIPYERSKKILKELKRNESELTQKTIVISKKLALKNNCKKIYYEIKPYCPFCGHKLDSHIKE